MTTGIQTVAFLAAIDRIPLDTCVAIEFLGPLPVAGARSRHLRADLARCRARRSRPAHAAVARRQQRRRHRPRRAGRRRLGRLHRVHPGGRRPVDGVSGLAITVAVAALTAAVAGIPQAAGHLTLANLAAAAGLAVLLPVLLHLSTARLTARPLPAATYGDGRLHEGGSSSPRTFRAWDAWGVTLLEASRTR